MPTSPAVWARSAFALGYAEHGTFPLSARTTRECLFVQQSAINRLSPNLPALVAEIGRSEGRRSSREQRHRDLYDFHGAAIAALLKTVLERIDTEKVGADLATLAGQQASFGVSPVERRRVVKASALTSILYQVSSDDRKSLNDTNADGYAHAYAHGVAEARSTPPGGGPPDPKLIAAASASALLQVPASTAGQIAVAWTTGELDTLAMGAALAAGDGKALGDAARATTKALVDTGRATRTYADQLHQVVTNTYVATTQAQSPGAFYRWVTAADPCPECEEAELESPYPADGLPDGPPLHPNCLCDLELVGAPAMSDS